MSLRLILSASLAAMVVVGCPLNERANRHSRAPGAEPRQVAQPLLIEAASQSSPANRSVAATKLVEEPHELSDGEVGAVALLEGESELAQPARVEPALPLHEDLVPERTLGALSKETVVHAAPRRSSRKLGFLRQGALVRREPEPSGHEGCEGGWYRIAPEGYVCVGKTATLDLNHPILQLASRRPDRAAPMPYRYGRARFPTPPLYTRIPTRRQQEQVEPGLAGLLAMRSHFTVWDDVPYAELPDFLLRGERVPRPFGYPVLDREFVSGEALPETGFAFLKFFETEGRRWGLTTDLSIVPLDRVEPVKVSDFHGLMLSDDVHLPVAFVRSKGAYLYNGDPQSTGLTIDRPLGYREAVPLGDQRIKLSGRTYLKTQSGQWMIDKHLVRVDPMKSRPRWAEGDRTWIEVSILDQTLVAYVGDKAVYTTLVSTGIGGLGDPEETHATVRGTFLIHTKHVSATMNSDEVGDEFDLRDVPYVQYFQDGYAFHAAYWHDSFGQPRSHGCINLSPADARWLFHWTEPAVPHAWHSALSLREGTLVYIHP